MAPEELDKLILALQQKQRAMRHKHATANMQLLLKFLQQSRCWFKASHSMQLHQHTKSCMSIITAPVEHKRCVVPCSAVCADAHSMPCSLAERALQCGAAACTGSPTQAAGRIAKHAQQGCRSAVFPGQVLAQCMSNA